MIADFDGEILIPNGNIGDFAVVACDQFSSCPEYWEGLKAQLPPQSALDIILPECYLAETEERLRKISEAAADMCKSGRFYSVSGTIAVTRTTEYGRIRRGVVAAIDLDGYDYSPDSKALIRASERTIESRIPPRVAIREAIDIEMPHIMLLVDDRENALQKAVDAAEKRVLYDCDLRGGGGHIKGELIAAGNTELLYKAVDDIIKASETKFSQPLFALVGDGNHSLATAKYCHENAPTKRNGKALVEIVNIYDEGLVFEPIHRLVNFNDPAMFADSLRSAVKGNAKSVMYSPDPMEISVPSDKIEAINAVDRFCETFVKHFGGSVEYVHGDDALKREGCIGISMRGIERSELFDYVLKNGVLPKKTFSLGEAEEKRFYIEARKIK